MRRDQKPILPSPYDVQVLAERFASTGSPRRYTLAPETTELVSRALRFYADVLATPRDEGGYSVDVWSKDGGIIETMARASGILVARAAYEQACRERSGYKVTLRHGVRLIETQNAPGATKSTGVAP